MAVRICPNAFKMTSLLLARWRLESENTEAAGNL
jgi:hypothetical protein